MRDQKGFTLIEILVVLIILSIVTSVAVMKVSHNQNKRVESVAQQLLQTLTLAQEQAMLQSNVLGLNLSSDSFQFDAYHAAVNKQKSLWEPLNNSLLSKQMLPDSVELLLQQGDEMIALDHATKKPQVIISTTGEVTPFTLYIAEKGHKPRFKIIGEANGHIELFPV